MKKYYLIFAMSCALLLPFSTYAWPEDGVVTLKMLIDGEITVAELVDHDLGVDQLVDSFNNDQNVSAKIRKNYLGKNKQRIKQLKAEEKEAVRAAKRREKTTKNKHFYGEPELAEDATLEMLELYEVVLAALREELAEGRINKSTYTACLSTVECLMFFHKNNRQICIEFSESTESATYGDRISLHPAERDVPFHLKAVLMHSWLSIYEVARQNGIVAAFFTDGLSKNNGCLEARFRALCEWHKRIATHLKSVKNLSPNSKANKLSKPVKEVVWGYIEANYERLSKETDLHTFEEVAADIASYFEGKVDSNGDAITPDDALAGLKQVFVRNSPVKTQPQKKYVPDRASPARRRLFSEEEEVLQANRESLNAIETVLASDGQRRRCKLIETKPDGNCGFSALGRITREQFIARVLQEDLDQASPRIRDLIILAMREVGATTIEEWAELFADPSHWMGETIMNLYALLYDVRIGVHALDHTQNIFTHIMTVNPDGTYEVNIVHVHLAPIENEEQLSLNHYDRLRIARDGEGEAIVVPAPAEDAAYEVDLGIVDRTRSGGFFGFGM